MPTLNDRGLETGHSFDIRAIYDESSVRMYQAFADDLASIVLDKGRFVDPFRLDRMSWIKPSFNWMMYRSGFATKTGQTTILAIDMDRKGFDWLTENSVPSQFDSSIYHSPGSWKEAFLRTSVRVQWDPERAWNLAPLHDVRTIQLGLSGDALYDYVNKWAVRITDVTALAHAHKKALEDGISSFEGYPALREKIYPTRKKPAKSVTP